MSAANEKGGPVIERYRAMLWEERIKWFARGGVIMAFAAYLFV